jgi:flagellar biosynthesis anti-sigma factor FlgM
MSNIKINKTTDPQEISAIRQSGVKKSDKTTTSAIENKSVVSSSADKIDFSPAAFETGRLVDELKSLPDIRAEKVVALRQQISSGDFKPSNEDIATAILKDEQ